MTLQEFTAKMSPIINRWKRGYSGDQVQLIYNEVETLSSPDFERLVTHLLGTMRVAPMIPDFKKGIMDLNIRVKTAYASTAAPRVIQEENILYRLEENVVADNDFVFIRGVKPSFIIKRDHPTHPLVMKDTELRSQRLKEAREHLKNGTYPDYMNDRPAPKPGLKLLNFSMEGMK